MARPVARHTLCVVLVFAMISIGPTVRSARAELVGAEALLSSRPEASQARERLRGFLARGHVRDQLGALGIGAEEAQARVDSLSDAEVEAIVGKLDRLPAGGDGVAALIGALLIVFLVLLFTDIVGLTDVFPWVRSR